MGIFAQRKKERINQIGLSIVELLEINGRTLKVKYLDAIDGKSTVYVCQNFACSSPLHSASEMLKVMGLDPEE